MSTTFAIPSALVQAPVLPVAGSTCLRTEGNQIVNGYGHPVRLVGVSWFGLETPTFSPHGLNVRGYKDMLNQIKRSGFNTLRLPFCSELFERKSRPTEINATLNPELQGLNGLGILDRLVDFAGKIGLQIVLDHHRCDAGGGPNGNGLWYTDQYPEAAWLDDWVMLASRYAGNPAVIGADLTNEPHGVATWGSGDRSTDWRLAAERAGNAILAVNPNWLIIVEGIEVAQSGHYWWGGNLSNAKRFPVNLNVSDRLVYSPHDYPASIYEQPWFSKPNYPKNLPGIWDKHWGYLFRENIAPLWLGEFGSKLATQRDRLWLKQMIDYLNGGLCYGLPAGKKGVSWSWWSWNPDSADTNGLLNDDWTTVNQTKLSCLAPAMVQFPPTATLPSANAG